MVPTPWNDTTQLVHIAIKGYDLVDVLHSDDSVAIVTYAGSVGVVLEPTPIADKAKKALGDELDGTLFPIATTSKSRSSSIQRRSPSTACSATRHAC